MAEVGPRGSQALTEWSKGFTLCDHQALARAINPAQILRVRRIPHRLRIAVFAVFLPPTPRFGVLARYLGAIFPRVLHLQLTIEHGMPAVSR
jgi:hypothetical protein